MKTLDLLVTLPRRYEYFLSVDLSQAMNLLYVNK